MGFSTVAISEKNIENAIGELTETSDFSLYNFLNGQADFKLITVNRSKKPTFWEKSDNGKYIANYGDSFAVFENVTGDKNVVI